MEDFATRGAVMFNKLIQNEHVKCFIALETYPQQLLYFNFMFP